MTNYPTSHTHLLRRFPVIIFSTRQSFAVSSDVASSPTH